MKIYHFLLIYSVFSRVLSNRLDIDSEECKKYLQKFDTLNSQLWASPTLLGFKGDETYVQGTANVQVNLRYTDPLFNDTTYWGLVQEDGKTAEATCLDLKLWKFTIFLYDDPVQVTDLHFTASSNSTNKWRYLSFTINGTDLATRTVQTSNSNQYLFTGYYAVVYYAAGTTLIKYIFYFQFTVVVIKSTGVIFSTVFKPLNPYEICIPTGHNTDECFYSIYKLMWCTDATCAKNTVPNLYLNFQFYIRFKVITTVPTDYYLTDTVVYYVGDGLNKKTTPISIDNSVKGQVTLLLTADIVRSNVGIQVTSYLSTSPTGEDTTTYDPISGITQTLTCITLNQDDSSCATCAEQCNANDGIAGSTCPTCPNSASLLAVTLFILLLYFF